MAVVHRIVLSLLLRINPLNTHRTFFDFLLSGRHYTLSNMSIFTPQNQTNFMQSVHCFIMIPLSILVLGGVSCLEAQEQSTNRRVVQSSNLRESEHLHIAYRVTNTEYRRQLLKFTPLGSSYEQVRIFAQAELQNETHPSGSIFDAGMTRQCYDLKTIDVLTELIQNTHSPTGVNRTLLQEEPPHARIVLTRGSFIEGTDITNVYFSAKPSLLGPWIVLSVVYVFDQRHRLLDVYCFSHGRSLDLP